MRIVRNLTAAVAVVVLTIAGIAAAVADDPPPRIAFLANGIVPADALAAGPVAGQLGAPIFTTAPDALVGSTATALTAYDPELVIVMGGPAAISEAVLDQVAAATGLTVVPSSPPPTSGIVRAAGQDRFETAAAAAALLAVYDPAFLPTDMQAVDSNKLDGKDSSAFQPAGAYALADRACTAGKVVAGIAADGTPICATDKVGAAFDGDADTLDGKDSTEFQPAGGYALADQECALGDVVSGVTSLGQLACSTDSVDGGDAETLDGLDSAAFASASLNEFVPVATFIVDDTGTVRGSQWRAPLFAAPATDDSGAASGIYEILLPGLSLTFFDDTVVCTRAETDAGTIRHEVVGGALRVITTDISGAGTPSWFHCAVFDG